MSVAIISALITDQTEEHDMSTLTSLDPTLTIREIIARHPDTKAVFERFGLDTCCGSGVPVDAAAERDGIDAKAVFEALRQVLDRR